MSWQASFRAFFYMDDDDLLSSIEFGVMDGILPEIQSDYIESLINVMMESARKLMAGSEIPG